MIKVLTDLFAWVQGWLFETVMQPLLFEFGWGEFTEQAFDGVEWFLIGVCEVALLYVLLRPLEALIPVYPINNARARWNDFLYTVLHRVGVFSLVIFLVLDPLLDQAIAVLHLQGVKPFNLENRHVRHCGSLGRP